MTTDDRKTAIMQTRYPDHASCGDDCSNDHNDDRTREHSHDHGSRNYCADLQCGIHRDHRHDHRDGHRGSHHHGHYCNRCDAPQGDIVTLNGAERVCGACIDLMGNLLAVAGRIAVDLTPSIECGADCHRVGGSSCFGERGLVA